MSAQVGSYTLIRLLGRGGMGEVWEALDTRNERRVALKLLPRDALRNPELERRFRKECRLAASVENPHVLPVYEYEVNDQPFIAMRLIRGTDLASEIKKGPLAPRRAVHIVEQVAAALGAAHELKLRHRDVKPSNILLEPGATRGTDHAWLFDWGIAQLIDISAAPVTRTGQIVGTPGYIAPERLQGAESDHRADVYSLAVVLYECLAARKPFVGSDWQVLWAHVHSEPPGLSPQVPAGLDAVLATGLAKRPADRYQSAPALAAAAREALAEPVRRPPESPIKSPREPTIERPGEAPIGIPRRRPPVAESAGVPHRARRPSRPVWGAGAGLLVALALLGAHLIDASMLVWILPVLVVAGMSLAWGLRPRPVPGSAPGSARGPGVPEDGS